MRQIVLAALLHSFADVLERERCSCEMTPEQMAVLLEAAKEIGEKRSSSSHEDREAIQELEEAYALIVERMEGLSEEVDALQRRIRSGNPSIVQFQREEEKEVEL